MESPRKMLKKCLSKPKTHTEGRNSPSSSQPSNITTFGKVFGHPIADFSVTYTTHETLAEGGYGVTKRVKDKSGRSFACKIIVLDQLAKPDLIRREVEILHHLAGHPNIINLREVIEDDKAVHVVMDLGKGGELKNRIRLFEQPTKKQEHGFKKLFKRKRCTEMEAKELFRQIATAIRDCHDLGVMHRDLKPQNMVFLTKKKPSQLKVIDFGLSIYFKPGDMFEEYSIGTPPYVAPEVAKEMFYGPKADIWVAGVILYTLLSGALPFSAVTVDDLPEAIRRRNLNDYTGEHWRHISNNAKELLSSMLKEEPEERISAAKILEHQWFRKAGDAPAAPRDITIITRMKQFQAMTLFQRITFKLIAGTLPREETMGWKMIYESFVNAEINDSITYKEGLIFDELKYGLYKWGAHLPDSELNKLMDSIDMNGDDIIQQIEFIAATVPPNRIERQGRLQEAFKNFDIDKDGCITMNDLKQALKNNNVADWKINEIIEEVYTVQDRRIDYGEFEAIIKKEN